MTGLWVGRPVGVLLPWAVIAVAAPWPMVTHPTSTCGAGVNSCYRYSLLLTLITVNSIVVEEYLWKATKR